MIGQRDESSAHPRQERTEGGVTMSRFGRQPAADVLKSAGIKREDAANQIGVKHSVLNNTLAGHQTPSDAVRDGLVKLLNRPAEELFTAEPLARRQGRRYREGARITEGDDPTITHRRRQPRSRDTDEEGRSREPMADPGPLLDERPD